MQRVEGMARGFMLRVIGTIIIFAGLLAGSLIYIGFYATRFNLAQDIIAVLVALIVAIAAIAIMWISWGSRRGWFPGKLVS
jgi:hypothetical protein